VRHGAARTAGTKSGRAIGRPGVAEATKDAIRGLLGAGQSQRAIDRGTKNHGACAVGCADNGAPLGPIRRVGGNWPLDPHRPRIIVLAEIRPVTEFALAVTADYRGALRPRESQIGIGRQIQGATLGAFTYRGPYDEISFALVVEARAGTASEFGAMMRPT
jgi:hypothetical protein